jgi:MFS superfamily sulfate permease-like transporter
LLGVLLIAGTAVATLAVAPRSAYLIIPVPALAYVTAAIAAGLVHDRATDTSRTALTVSAVQWIASGFLVMSAATVLAIAVAAARRLRSSHGPRHPWPP